MVSPNFVCSNIIDSNTNINSILGINIAAVVIKVITDYEISERVGFFVLDNADNNDTAVKAIFQYLRPKIDPKARRIRCAGHVINLVA